MLQVNKRSQLSGSDSQQPKKPIIEALSGSFKIIRRQLPIVIVIFTCCVALGLLVLLTSKPRYTATGTMLLDTRKVQLLEQQSVLGELQVDAATVQTQVEVLKSENISLAVIRKLDLTEDPEFVGPGTGLISMIIGFLKPTSEAEAPPTRFELEQTALERFQNQRTVARLGLTYVMEVGFTSSDPEKSAKIVNTLVESYVADQLDAKYQAARRAGLWLLARVNELRTNAATAERAVADFKEKNNIVDAGGKLMGEQQLGELNSQLIIARAATAEAKARLDRIGAVMTQDIADASMTDALKSEVIIKLRGHYLDVAQREAIWAQRYGANHLATVNLRSQMRELRHSIQDQMRKIAESYESEYQIAQTRADSLEKSLANVVTQSHITGQAQVQLHELESNKDSARAIYDNFLHRYMEAVQQQEAVPISETRLISPATPPLRKSSPKTMMTLLVTLAAGGLLSFAVAYLREASDGVLRTTDQVENNLHVNCLAMVPTLKPTAPAKGARGIAADSTSSGYSPRPSNPNPLRYVVDAPFSRYAEALRSVKIAADINGALKSQKIIGFTSTLPNEGKSTLAANLAHLIADAGASAVLVDADLRSPTLSQMLCPDAPGLIDAVIGKAPLDDVLTTLPGTRLTFLPAGATSKLPHTNEILASAALKSVMEMLRAKFDYVIVDLSPIAPIVDVRATGHIIDSYVFVIEWGKTKIDIIERALTDAPGIYDQMLGVVLNKVDTSVQGRYERYHGNQYFRKYYAKYGYVE